MGLDYAFEIYCDRSKLWEFIDCVTELAKPDAGQTLLIYGDKQKTFPHSLKWGKEKVWRLEAPDRDGPIEFCLSLPFVVDSEIAVYIAKDQPHDEQGRAFIGCIDFSLMSVEFIEESDVQANLICFEFPAATSQMSRLFLASQSIQKAFVDLAKQHDAVRCMFSSCGSNKGRVLWLDGQEYDLPVFADWLSTDEVRQIVKSRADA